MKFYSNKKYQTAAVYAAVVIAVNVLLVLALNNVGEIFKWFGNIFKVMQPITWGLVVAFLTNPIMEKTASFMRKRIYKTDEARQKASGFIKVISVLITEIIFLGIVVGLVAIVVPELIRSVMDIFNNASLIINNVQSWINKVFRNYPSVEQAATNMLSDFNTDFSTIIQKIQPMLENVLSGAWGIVTVVKNFLLGFIVSVYMLCCKETLLAQIKKIIIALTRKRTCERIMNVCSQANTVF